MDAPQLPDADASASRTGPQPPGQASAFRRALDAQLEPADPSTALVPSAPHDLTAPIDLSLLRTYLGKDAPSASRPGSVGSVGGVGSVRTGMTAPRFPDPPSANGPAVVAPAVSVPALRAPTTIVTTGSHRDAVVRDAATQDTTTRDTAVRDDDQRSEPPDDSPRHGGGSGAGGDKSSRLPTAVGVSALLAALAATALVLLDNGRSGGPLAPTALPTKAATQSAAPPAAQPVAPPPKASTSASPSHTTVPPSRTATPAPSSAPSRTAGPSSSAVPSFTTIYWTTDSEAVVADIQSRLARLGYLMPARNDSQYVDTQRTLRYVGNSNPDSDGVGYYQNATDAAIRAFKFEYLQHRQGQFPGGGCDSQTYQALIKATG